MTSILLERQQSRLKAILWPGFSMSAFSIFCYFVNHFISLLLILLCSTNDLSFFLISFFTGELIFFQPSPSISSIWSFSSDKPVPLIEPILAIILGPPANRNFLLELIVVIGLPYSILVAIEGLRERLGLPNAWMILLYPFRGHGGAPRPKRSLTNELGSGDLATTEQILEWTKIRDDNDTRFKVENLQGCNGVALRTGEMVIPSSQRNRHMLIVAKTGSGKTTKLILPVLYSDCMSKSRSVIVIDSKPEMWGKLASMTQKYNPEKKIRLFNPLDTLRSLSWNILSKIKDETDAKLIANTVIMATDNPSSKGDSPFFRNNALSVLNSVMVGLLNDPNDILSMPRIHQLVQSGMKELCNWIEAHPHALRNSRSFVELARSGSQNADTIMSELSMRLAAWDLPAIRAMTAENELDVEDLISHPTLLVVEFRESELEMLRPMANVIVVELLRFLTKRAESEPGHSLPRPVGLVIDEFASALGRLPDIHVKLNTLRSRNVSIVAAIQSTQQVKANYGDDADSVLAGFSTKIFMPALDLVDSEYASKESGQMTIRFKTSSKGTNKKLIEVFASKNDSTQEQVQQRAVLTPDEIGRPVNNIETFFLPNTPVFQGFLTPFYKDPVMLKRLTEFGSRPEDELRMREKPVVYLEDLPTGTSEGGAPSGGSAQGGGGGGGGESNSTNYGQSSKPGISNTRGWTEEQFTNHINEVRSKIGWNETTGSAKKWWEAFESENKSRPALVVRLSEELLIRNATITEFFLAYVYSNTDNIQANLNYLDYTRLKKEEERRKKARQQASG
jgi:type IV secretory pathway TraG/TraD family ATPase VirD4